MGLLAINEVQERCGPGACEIQAGSAVVDIDKLFGVRIWQGLEQHSFDDGEDRAVGSDADRKCEDSNRRESWGFEKASKDVFEFHA